MVCHLLQPSSVQGTNAAGADNSAGTVRLRLVYKQFVDNVGPSSESGGGLLMKSETDEA